MLSGFDQMICQMYKGQKRQCALRMLSRRILALNCVNKAIVITFAPLKG